MIRLTTFLTILIVGLGLFWSQIFSDDHTVQVLSSTLSYENLGDDIKAWESRLENISKKLALLIQNPLTEPSSPVVTPAPETPVKNIDRDTLTADNILYFTNIERTKAGLSKLSWNADLTRSATAKSKDMVVYQYFAHVSPGSKKDMAYFINQEHYDYLRISENLAMGDFSTAKEVVTAWMGSPTHRANIMLPEYRDLGVSVRNGIIDDRNVTVIVQHFGIPQTACPAVSHTLLSTIQSIQREAESFKKTAEDLENTINSKEDHITDRELDKLIILYNNTIVQYNNLVKEFDNLAGNYNRAVQQYNACIDKLN